MGRPDGLIELPNGSAIFYDDDRHAYYRAKTYHAEDGSRGWSRSTRLTGCSTLAKPFNYDSGRLLAWKERVTCEGIADLVNNDLLDGGGNEWLRSEQAIRSRLKLAGSDADSVRDKKATLGTNVHRVLEGLAGVCDLPNVDEMPEEEKGYARAVFKWWEERRPVVTHAEQFVYSETHGYAGRFDLRAHPENSALPYLLDLKTSSFIGPQYHVQLALYELAARECGVGESHVQIVLQVKPDGTWREIPCQATERDALAAIAVYRGVARIEREARAA